VEGFTPTVDEHSIKVDGTGSATITDLSVQLVPNKEIFEEIYPSDDEDEDEDDEDDEDDESDKEEDAIKSITEAIKQLGTDLKREEEKVASASSRLSMLEHYANSLQESRPDDLEDCIRGYRDERAKVFDDHLAAQTKCEELRKKIRSSEKKKARLGKAAHKAQLKRQAAKARKLAKKQRKLQEIAQEKERIRAERNKFWPKKVYKLIISLDAPSGSTPATSRRGSIDSLVKVAAVPSETKSEPETSRSGDVNLSISYITYSASWSPRYDLSLNTVTNSGVLDYCAELKNTTSETWRDTKVVLSTSQTAYQGLEDTIPIMQPWHVRLMKNAGNGAALYSQYEQSQKSKNRQVLHTQALAPRGELFGRDQQAAPFNALPCPKVERNAMQMQMQMQVQQEATAHHSGSRRFSQAQPYRSGTSNLTGGASLGPPSGSSAAPTAVRGGFFGQTNAKPPPPPASFGSSNQLDAVNSEPEGSSLGHAAQRGLGRFRSKKVEAKTKRLLSEEYDEREYDPTLVVTDSALAFEESSFEESGLTTTYDVPTLKTIAPMSSTTKHKIARIEFKSIIFSHIVIPKLKPSAFLKARLRNASKITLLKGTAGLTLDGSFLGQSTIPRCSAGDSFTLPLGVDPAISVNYAKPTVRRSQSGIFSKEDCEVFTRVATITNTKHNGAVELQVLDQVPVSEDERLRIDIATPRGLKIGGDPVPAGMSAQTESSAGTIKDGSGTTKSAASNARMSIYSDDASRASGLGKDIARWGSATATAKKGGEVNWTVKINPLKSCKLVLEYEATYPGGETVTAVN
jgi:Domain of unknown function (DUF4139)/N-terminal domain of unknown function (DUF4140)